MPEHLSWPKFRQLATGPRKLGVYALLAIVATLLFCVYQFVPLVRAVTIPAAPAVGFPSAADKSALADSLQKYADRINGRSPFFQPRAPARPVEAANTGPREPAAAPKPTRYGGPSIVGMINGAVWFADGTKLKVGDAPAAGGKLKLLALTPPWSARVDWDGVEFTVPFFERSPLLAAKELPTVPTTPKPAVPEALADPVGRPAVTAPAEPAETPSGDPPSTTPSAEPTTVPVAAPGSIPPQPAPTPAPSTNPTQSSQPETR